MIRIFRLISILSLLLPISYVMAYTSEMGNIETEEDEITELSYCFWSLKEVYTDSIKTDDLLFNKHDFLFMKDDEFVQGRNDTMLVSLKSTRSINNKKMYLRLPTALSTDLPLFTFDVLYENKFVFVLRTSVLDSEGKNHTFEYRYYKNPLIVTRFLKPSQGHE